MRPKFQHRWLFGAVLGAVLGIWGLWPRVDTVRLVRGFGGRAGGRYPAARSSSLPAAPQAAAALDPEGAKLQVIQAGLREWLRASRPVTRAAGYDKDGQDSLQNNLLALVTPQNAAAVLQSLSPREMDSPLGITAAQRWLEADPAGAARWIASCPFATDDQAWAVAREAVADGRMMEELCSEPVSAWKDSFLRYASLEVLAVDPAEAARLARRMAPSEARRALLRQIGGAPDGSAPASE